MKTAVQFLSPLTAFSSTLIGLLFGKVFMNVMTTWPDGYAPPHSPIRDTAFVGAYIVFILVMGLLIGLLHGWTFGLTYRRRITIAATIPLFAFWLLMSLGTGFAFLALPAVIGFYWVVDLGVKYGSGLPNACALKE